MYLMQRLHKNKQNTLTNYIHGAKSFSFKKLKFAQLVKKLTEFHGPQTFITVTIQKHHLDGLFI
jgi:hypothetical protein